MVSEDPIIKRLQEFMTVKDLAERTGVSRAAIYNYSRHYAQGNKGKVPSDLCELFVHLTEGTDEQIKAFVDNIPKSSTSEHRMKKIDAAGRQSVAAKAESPKNDVWTLCIRDSTGSMVIFQNVPDVESTILKLYIRVDRSYYCIGTYRPEPEKNFILIKDIVRTIDYFYEVEQECSDGTHRSDLIPLENET